MPTSALKLYDFVVEYPFLLDSRHGETHANLFTKQGSATGIRLPYKFLETKRSCPHLR